jgi:ATP-dependent Clp protease protease subunit
MGEFEEENPLVQLANNRIIMLTGEIDEAPITITIAHLFNLAKQDPVKPIHLVINTYGGSVDDMLALYDAIQFVSCPVHTLGLGKIMSAGIFLLAAGKKGHRQIGKNARCMYHMMYGSYYDATVLDQESELEECKRMQGQINKLLIKHTGLTDEDLDEWMELKKDIYITPQEAIEWGIADKFLTRWQT